MGKRSIAGFLSIGFILTQGLAVAAEIPSEIGRLTYVQGRVDRSGPANSQTYVPVVKEETISLNDIVRTKSF
ncbi:MAG: hypothetical protein Q7R83_02570, partial [bacterium]|nr:hypothetical protein [bacterium]